MTVPHYWQYRRFRYSTTARKTETITVRIAPAVKAGLRAVAEQERRSLANMIEVMILDYCEQSNVEIPEIKGVATKTEG